MSRKCWENREKVILSFALHADCITCLSRLFIAVTLGTGTGSVDTALNLNSKQQITLGRRFSSGKALSRPFFVDKINK